MGEAADLTPGREHDLDMPSIGKRLVAATLGALFGGVIGAILAWLLGMYSRRLVAPPFDASFKHWILGAGLVFAMLGLLRGSGVADLIGDTFNAVFRFEWGSDDDEASVWGWLVAVALGLILAWFWYSGSAM